MAASVASRCKSSFVYISNRKKVEMFIGKRFHIPTRLRTAASDIAAEWDYEKNPMHLYPEIIGIGYVSPVWWKCSVCNHSYKMSVEKRVVRGAGCDVCAHGVFKDKNKEQQGSELSLVSGVPDNVGETREPFLFGEMNSSLRPKRPAMLNIRTKY